MSEQNTALLGAYIRILREARGWSLRDLATEAGISHTTVDNIEKGYDPRTGRTTNITLETLYRLSSALHTSTASFFACLDGTARVLLKRPVDTWYEDEQADLEHEKGGMREYLRLKWGQGSIDFPTSNDNEAAAKQCLFGSYLPTAQEWEQVKQFANFLKNK